MKFPYWSCVLMQDLKSCRLYLWLFCIIRVPWLAICLLLRLLAGRNWSTWLSVNTKAWTIAESCHPSPNRCFDISGVLMSLILSVLEVWIWLTLLQQLGFSGSWFMRAPERLWLKWAFKRVLIFCLSGRCSSSSPKLESSRFRSWNEIGSAENVSDGHTGSINDTASKWQLLEDPIPTSNMGPFPKSFCG